MLRTRVTRLVARRLSLARALSQQQLYSTYPPQSVLSQLTTIQSKVDSSSPAFKENVEEMNKVIDTFKEISDHAANGIPEKIRSKHIGRNKLLPRDRIGMLIDPGTSFMELSSVAGYKMYDSDDIRAGGIITGIGTVSGTKCLIVANDSTVKGGTYYPITVRKHLRAQEIARENKLPCLYLVDSGGANLPHQADVFPSHNHFGRIFFQQSRMSSEGIPQLALVMGPCTAGGAYVPAMSDESIIVKGGGHIFLAGPPLVKAATGEVISAEDLGGGELHSKVSGVTDYLVQSEEEGIVQLRQCVENLNKGSNLKAPEPFEEPLYDSEELLGIVSPNLRKAFDAREVIARIVDASKFTEFKKEYGTSIVTGWAKIWGHPVGILANNGPLFSESALKGAHFIELCKQRGTPLIFLQNITGFMVGSDAEKGGIAKNGAKLVNAVVGSGVERYTVVIGGSYGAGNYGMCGRAYEPRFLWSWPNSRTAVMGPEQLASVMETVSSNKGASDSLRERIEAESLAVFGSARLWDDGIILPQHTRAHLGHALEIRKLAREQAKLQEEQPKTGFGVWRM